MLQTVEPVETAVACVNGVALHAAGEQIEAAVLRQRAGTELLRQAAQRAGLLDVNDPPHQDGAISAAATQAIEALLVCELDVPEPDEEACRRHYAARAEQFRRGERLWLRHVLLAVTPGVDVDALRRRAEQLLVQLRCADAGSNAFAQAAQQWSNCPSGAAGGELGWVERDDCAAEFARDVFAHPGSGVLPRLVHSRFGFHVVEICRREQGWLPAYEEVSAAVRLSLRQQSWIAALRQYVQRLAGGATLDGVDLDARATPLLQ